jgi:hypothetical protein
MAKSPKRTREQWSALISQMEASGLTQTTWCKQNQINYSSMMSMKATLQKAQGALGDPSRHGLDRPTGFVIAKAVEEKPLSTNQSPSLELRFGGLIVSVRLSR